MGKIYANLKDLIKSKKEWKNLEENKHFDLEDLVIRGSTWDAIWVRIVGNGHEAMEYLYNIMDLEKRFIRFMIDFSVFKRVRLFQEGRIIPEDEGYLEIDATKDVISIDEHNKLGERVGSVMMNWKSYEVMKRYLEDLKTKIGLDDNE
ncbi:MAG: hypothetical protein DRP41_02670 [Thermodesulfobacteriota bacterium]|nr:MAG: hypothetical protein DRP41_02670 [Thermodesulfobacteriota bacterium]